MGGVDGVYHGSKAKRCELAEISVAVRDGIPVRKFQGGREAGKRGENGLRLSERKQRQGGRGWVFFSFSEGGVILERFSIS